MSEDFLQTIWKNRWFTPKEYKSSDGRIVNIISSGYLNENDGPDFTNAKVEIDGILWAGNIEIHTNASDWNTHGHNKDANYNNVILHVTNHADKEVFTSNHSPLCTIEIEYSQHYEKNLLLLLNSLNTIACSTSIHLIDNFFIKHWLTQLATDRLEWRCIKIKQQLKTFTNDWENAFYITLARYFGFGINNTPFEQLARSIPIVIISKHYGNIFQLEALFFGQAGLLTAPYSDQYHEKLALEYHFLCEKYGLKPIDATYWKFMRIRPSNFPTIRIAEFVALLNLVPRLFEQCLMFTSLDSLKAFLTVNVSEYWQKHYVFAKEHPSKTKHLGSNSSSLLLINAVIPFIFAYGKFKNNESLCDRAMTFYESLQAESNSIISKWIGLNIVPSNAMESQALLHLNEFYCKDKKCLQCNIGQRICEQSLNKTIENN